MKIILICLFAFSWSTPLIKLPKHLERSGDPLPGCQIYHDNQCSGNDIITPNIYANRRWFTPNKGEPGYQDSFQSYARIVANAHTVYSSDRTKATVEIRTIVKDSSISLKFLFDGEAQTSNIRQYDKSQLTTVNVQVLGSDGSSLNLEPIDFLWNAPKIANQTGDYRNGQKGAIVEAFGWPHKDIEAECATLSKLGYLGVKVFPAQEQIMSNQPFNQILNPWYFMYQPVSYRLQGRMGTRDDLRSLIYTCRKFNVRVYADAVVNHMTGGGNDANPYHRNPDSGCAHWGNKNSSLSGGSSPFYTQSFVYTTGIETNEPPSQEFPAATYGPLDFHCERPLNSWNDPLDLNAGWLTGLTDLNTERDNVQERIADYMTDLIGIGISGFRIDAAKHIKPDDLVAILTKFRRNVGGTLPDDFITWLEVLLGGESDLLMCNPNSGYNYGAYLANQLLQVGNFSQEDVDKVKIWNSGYPKEPEKGTCTITAKRSVIQNDDADQQNPGSSSRDMADQGCVLILTPQYHGCSSIEQHRQFEVKLFQNPNGANDNDNDFPIRMVLSSFYWQSQQALGIPDGLSDCSKCTITCDGCQTVTYQKAFDPNSCGYDKPGYTRVHRDATIVAAMRKWMHLPSVSDIGIPKSCTPSHP